MEERSNPPRIFVHGVVCTCYVRVANSERLNAFPKWQTLHSYFAKWSHPYDEGVNLLEQTLKIDWRGSHETGTGTQHLHRA